MIEFAPKGATHYIAYSPEYLRYEAPVFYRFNSNSEWEFMASTEGEDYYDLVADYDILPLYTGSFTKDWFDGHAN